MTALNWHFTLRTKAVSVTELSIGGFPRRSDLPFAHLQCVPVPYWLELELEAC
jgi:hypothetical protein